MSPFIQELSRKLLEAIRSVADPQLVIVFGSQVDGQPNEHSDVDVLVVEDRERWKTATRHQEIGRLRRAIPQLGRPIDLLLFTPAEVSKWQTARNHVIAQALARGEVLYERH